MNQTRTFLLFAWLMLAVLIWQAWEQDHAPPPANRPTAASVATSASASPASTAGLPAVPLPTQVPATTAPAGTTAPTAISAPAAPPVELANDVLRLRIDPRGASLVGADLLAYAQGEQRGSPPFELLDDSAAHLFVAESGIVSASGHAPNHAAVYQVEGSAGKQLAAGAESVSQTFLWTDPSGVQVRKTYTLHRGSYVIDLREEIRNGSTATWTGNDYRWLRRVPPIIKHTAGGSLTNPEAYAFVGAAWYSPEDKYETRALTKFETPLDKTVTGGWMAMVQHYFLAAWIPDPKEATKLSIASNTVDGQTWYSIIAQGPGMSIPAGGSHTGQSRLYVGPALQDVLPHVAPGLQLTVDYGWFTLFAGPIFWLLSKLHLLIGNWGWAIVLLVLAIKLAMYKLSDAQYRSMAKMRALQPRLEALKERYGDDKQQFQMAMLELYKKEKVNPAGGCLPMLIQIPIFLALYRVLLYSVELRHAPWIGWIHSLSDPDPYFVLPVLYLAVMFFTQRLTPTPGMDPTQKKMMQAMPMVFGVMFAFFPSGLVLYYVMNGSLGLLQQWWLMRKHGAPGALPKKA
ncbi:MAG: membrane protein insertase YidC [Proteobacteria bacterium]|nr:membrane protein insertase YidC [Pseudomonadota bacterium]